MKIAFYMGGICVRGTSIATYDYADYNEKILGNKSIIIIPKSSLSKNERLGVVRFASRFSIKVHKDLEDLDKILEQEGCDAMYNLKYGTNDGVLSKRVKNLVHCVFDMSEPHGDVYAGVSCAMSRKFGKDLFVPHMVGLKPGFQGECLRKELGIPEGGIVFGRYGGMDTFNIQFCMNVIVYLVSNRRDVYFLFINTPEFYKHPSIFYLPKITGENDKNRFIQACDCHLECGTLGHSFGLAMGEFSVNNKPVVAYRPVPNTLWNTAHLDILGEGGLYFKDEREFYDLLNNFNPKDYEGKDLNFYKEYSPEKVMSVFSKVFLDK
jgi:hypothetical protein